MRKHISISLLACLIMMSISSSIAFAQSYAGRIHSIKGSVIIVRGSTTIQGSANEKVFPKDEIKTGPESMAELIMKDGSSLTIGPDSTLELSQFLFSHGKNKPSFFTRMIKGVFIYISGAISKVHPGSVKFKTSGATIGIRGTKLVIKILKPGDKDKDAEDESIILNLRDPAGKVGTVIISNAAGEQVLNKEFHAVSVPGNAAPLEQTLMSKEAVKKMLPPLLHPLVLKDYNPPLPYTSPIQLLEDLEDIPVPEGTPEVLSPYSPE